MHHDQTKLSKRTFARRLCPLLLAACTAIAAAPSGYAAQTNTPLQPSTTPPASVQPSGTAVDAQQLASPERVVSIEGITEYKLANGLRVLLAPDPSKPTTTVNMTYLVGSRHENYGQTGMAHLLEHLLFKGTKNIRNALGEFSRRGLSANGSTSDDRTNYYATFSANEDTLEWYLGWQADAMTNSLIAKADLDSEMTVVRNEMDRGENSPMRILMQKMSATAYEWHNYGKSTIGARSDVENVDIEQLRDFYRLYYQPDNAVLVVSGAFDAQKTLAIINRDFSAIPKPERTLPRLYTVEPVQDGERAVTLRRNGGTPLVATMYHIPPAGAPDQVAFDLASEILGDTPSGRLYKAMVAQNLATSVFSYPMTQFDAGTALFGAELEGSIDPQASLKVMIDTLESIAQHPFTEVELKRAQDSMLNSWERAYSDPETVGIRLSEAIASGDWRLLFLERDQVRKATLASVQQAAERYLLPSNRTAGTYIPTEKPVRAPAFKDTDFDALFKDYKGDGDFQAAESFDTSTANIDSRTKRSVLELPNGKVELALLNKPTRGARVEASLEIQTGDEKNLQGQRSSADALGVLLLRGTPTMTRQDIQDRFQALNARVNISTRAGQLDVTISTTEKNLADTVSTVLDIIRTADFPAPQVAEYKRELTTLIQQNRSEPQALAARAIARHNNPWPSTDPRYVSTFDEMLTDLEKVSSESATQYRDRFVGMGNASFVAVGQFDEAAVKDALKKSLANWKQAPAFTRLPIPFRDVPAKQFDILTPDKANAFYLSRQWLALQDTNADYPALLVANFLLGASEKSRLWLRVREKEGLSYSVRSQFTASSFQPNAAWTIYAIYAPGDRERLEKAIKEELSRVLADGFSDDEVEEAKQAILNYRALSRAQDQVLVSTWSDYLETGRTFKWSADIDKKTQQLTTSQINDALRRYLKPDEFTRALAGDFKASGATADRALQSNGQTVAAPASSTSATSGK